MLLLASEHNKMIVQAYEDTHRLSEGESGSDGDDMSDDEDMHDDDDEASPSLESDHDHGESGEEDDDDDPDDDDEDDRGSSDDSLSDHSFDHIDGEGDTDADAEVNRRYASLLYSLLLWLMSCKTFANVNLPKFCLPLFLQPEPLYLMRPISMLHNNPYCS